MKKEISMKTKSKILRRIICCFAIACLIGNPMDAAFASVENQPQIGGIGVDITWFDIDGKYKNYWIQNIWGTDYYQLSMVEDDDNNGYQTAVVNGKGQIVVEPDVFDVSSSSYNDFTMTILRKGNECYLISSEGFAKMDASPYSELNPFYNGYATVTLAAGGDIGVIDASGKLLFSTGEYKNLTHIGDGVFATSGNMGQDFYVSGYLLNASGDRLSETSYDSIDYVSEGMIRVSRNSKYGFVDLSGKEAVPAKYGKAYNYQSGVAAVQVNGKWGLIDRIGAEIAPPDYDDAYALADTLYWVSKGGKFGVMNTAGELILPIEYDNISRAGYEFGIKRFTASKGDEVFLMDEAGDIILSGDYSYMTANPDGTINVGKVINGSDVSANLDEEGNNLTGFKEFSLYYLSDDMLLGVKHGEYPPNVTPPHDYDMKIALFDANGNNLTGFIYRNSGDFFNDYLIVTEQYYQPAGLINRYGAEVLPAIFDDICLTADGYAFLQISDSGTGSNSRVGFFKIPESFNDKKRTPPITVYLDDVELYFDVEPTIVNGRAMVPMRKIFESLGAEISWDGKERKVTAVRDGVTVELTIAKDEALVDGGTVTLDVPAIIKESRALVPLRFVAEALGCDANWDSANRRVNIVQDRDE